MTLSLPGNQEKFEKMVMEKFQDIYPEIKHIIKSQRSVLKITERVGSGTGCFIHFDVPNEAPNIPLEYKSPLHGPNFRVAGVKGDDFSKNKGPVGSLVFIENGKMVMLECFAWTEGWPSELYDFEYAPDIEIQTLDEIVAS